MYSIVKVVPEEEFTLSVEFDDGRKRNLDMKPYLNFGKFNRISDPEKFRKVRIAFDTVEWDCGVDLDPEFIRSKSVPVS
jgi:hypothetical protein